MQLSEALEQLKAGEALHRTGWNPQDGYVVLMPGMQHVWKIVLQPAPNAGNFIFSFEDMISSDWEKFTGLPATIESPAA
jgi:hypothetical protein